ncbi:MAG: Pup-protein ligase [Candidatus Woesebacteria bacterium GW2011_GWA1_41_13b]|nr:MAG: Pup-protein ligase [Candidatus Woesebacteria bacterium GW2011_GWA1_41_13b]
MGLEKEYGLYGVNPKKMAETVDKILSQMRTGLEHLAIEAVRYRTIYWSINGAKLYNDTQGDHLEYATPECESFKDIVACDKAGEKILIRLVNSYNQKEKRKILILKNNISYYRSNETDGIVSGETSWGDHECYLLEAFENICSESRFIDNILPHLVTEIIYTGAGHIESLGDSYCYVLSSRAGFITKKTGESATADRPFIMRRYGQDTHADYNKWLRYQVVSNEANMLEVPTFLKFLTTHLCFRLVEEGWQLPIDLALDAPSQLKKLNRDIYLEDSLELLNGQTKKAIDIERVYLEAAKTLDLTDEERKGLELWEWVLDLLSCDLKLDGNLKKLFGVLDRTTKWYWLKKRMEKRNWPLSHPEILGMNLKYHILSDSPKESLWCLLNLKDKEEPFIYRVVSEEEIERALTEPPQTRAKIRSDFIKLACHYSPERFKVINSDIWSEAVLEVKGENKQIKIDFGNDDPLNPSRESFENFKRMILENTPGH